MATTLDSKFASKIFEDVERERYVDGGGGSDATGGINFCLPLGPVFVFEVVDGAVWK